MEKNIKRTAIGVALALASTSPFAAKSEYTYTNYSKNLKVIEDRGGQSIDKYIEKNNDAQVKMNEVRQERKNKTLFNSQFPVVTKSLTVGRVTKSEANDLKYEMSSNPLFIVGYDAVSINWLKANKSLLSDNKAVGLVVNVETQKQMDFLQELVGTKVILQPTPGDRLAEHLKIKHYPFYMDNKGVLR